VGRGKRAKIGSPSLDREIFEGGFSREKSKMGPAVGGELERELKLEGEG